MRSPRISSGMVLVLALVAVLAGCTRPTPSPPVPPAPIPTPAPVPPQPADVCPITTPGLRVVILEETAEREKLTAGQREILFSAAIRDALSSSAVEWRIFDKDADLTFASPEARALAQHRAASGSIVVPWVAIANPPRFHAGALPATSREFLDLLEKFK